MQICFSVFGLFESSDSSVIFELRFGSNLDVINMPAADMDLSIESVTGFCAEDSYQNGTELHIEVSRYHGDYLKLKTKLDSETRHLPIHLSFSVRN